MNTKERIKEILDDMAEFNLNELDFKILRLQLENLVTQAQLEQLQKESK